MSKSTELLGLNTPGWVALFSAGLGMILLSASTRMSLGSPQIGNLKIGEALEGVGKDFFGYVIAGTGFAIGGFLAGSAIEWYKSRG